MSGELDLNRLIEGMRPVLHKDTFVFTTTTGSVPQDAHPIMLFQEAEGLTMILAKKQAIQQEIPFEFESRMITLNVHSALDAVGFLARITTHLAALGMGVNPVSGFYHDHLFVPESRADEALAALIDLTKQNT